MKRFFAFLLVATILLGLVPSAFANEKEDDVIVYTEEDYITADLMWEGVTAKEEEMMNKKATANQMKEAIIAQITASPYYEKDTLIQNGEYIFWETVDGIPCGYSPRLSQIGREATPLEGYDVETAPTVLTTGPAKKGGSPVSNDIYLIQPYYGLDSSFTTQYLDEANTIAKATGGNVTTYRTTSATIDAIANAIEAGGVIIFDSHGDTDYANGEDSVSNANSSYLCLQVGTGLTSDDYAIAQGAFGTYYHAFYGGSYNSMKYYCVDGTAIANHMDKKSSNSLLWMAICLSMATEGLQAPLRTKGVEVAYGYSQSVTFEYDYAWEEAFWSKMRIGSSVSEAIAYMKQEVGQWDWCHSASYDTIPEAREQYCAFPIVVSSEDVYPGHGNVDDLQTVESTYMLFTSCPHTSYTKIAYKAPTCTEDGNIAYYRCSDCNALFSDPERTNRIESGDTVLTATGHKYDSGVITIPAQCKTSGEKFYTCTICKYSYSETISPLGHDYVSGVCTRCNEDEPVAEPFEIGISGKFVIAANVKGVYYAFPNTYTTTSTKFDAVIIDAPYGYVEEEDAEPLALEFTYDASSGTYTIYNGSYYLRYPTGTNLGGILTPYYWTVEKGNNGSWRLVSSTTTRGMVYRAGSYHTWGGYYLPNVVAGSKEYFDVELLPVAAKVCRHAMGEGVVTVAPTCTDEGLMTYTCTLCSQYTTTEAIPATGHSWGTSAILVSPTCVETGIIAYYCDNCDENRDEPIPATGEHTYENGICTGCGDILPAPEPTVDTSLKINHTLNLASDISVNYAVKNTLLASYDSYYLSCVLPVYTGNGTTEECTITIDPVVNGNYTYFTLSGMTAVQMTDEVHATLYLTKDGVEYCSETDIYSVSAYAYSQLERDTVPESLKKLCAELLRYGSAAQTFKGYRTDELADSKLTVAQQSYLAPLDAVTFNSINSILSDLDSPTVSWVSKTLNLESKVSVKFIVSLAKFTGDPSDLEFRYSYVNYAGETVNGVITEAQVYHEGLKYYYFELDSLLAAELRSSITAAIYSNGEQVSKSTVYSPDSYANGRTGDLLTLCQALISYSDTALAYFKGN